MAVSPDSRYFNEPIETVTDDRGTHSVINVQTPGDLTSFFTFYQVREGDTIDQIAFNAFGSSLKWWLIADVNPEILDWWTLPVGTVIRLPNGG